MSTTRSTAATEAELRLCVVCRQPLIKAGNTAVQHRQCSREEVQEHWAEHWRAEAAKKAKATPPPPPLESVEEDLWRGDPDPPPFRGQKELSAGQVLIYEAWLDRWFTAVGERLEKKLLKWEARA